MSVLRRRAFGFGLEEEDVIDDNECKFVNAFIDSIGASVEVGARRPVIIRDHHCDSEAAIFTNDRSVVLRG